MTALARSLRNRGLQDILIAVVDGLKGFPEAIQTVFPQTCIVHLVRHSLSYCGWQDRKLVAAELRTIYWRQRARRPSNIWNTRHRQIGPEISHHRGCLEASLEQVIPFFAYPLEVQRVIYTTNAIESLHMQLRKIIKNRGHFPSDDAAAK